jgi:RND family efflux transporter MFP subunit
VKLVPAEELGERTWVPATVSAVDHAVLATRVSARIAELTVAEGARVKRGDVLVRLSDDDVRATLKAAESQREVAEAQVKRIQALRQANAATATEVDAAMTARADALARVESARATLADTVLRAPFDAVVQRKWVSRGQLVAPGAPLLELDGTVVELTGTLSESEAASLAVGAEVPFRVGTAEGTATVVALSPGGDPLSHRSAFRARPSSGSPALRSGDFGRIGVKGAGGPRRAVPRTAVVQRGDLSGVFVVADGRAALRWLRLGEPEGDQLPVLAGLAPGERVIDSPGNVRDGQRVEVAGD